MLHGFGHGFAHGFGHGHGKVGASMLVITLAVDCNMLHGCPHVGHGVGFGHVLHGFGHVLHGFAHPQSAIAGMANITATANTNTTAANFFITTPFF